MSILSFDILRSYYLNDPAMFLETLRRDSTLSQIYRDLVANIISGIETQFNSTGAKIVRMDFDGNIMFSNNDAYFGQTKEDVKNICSRVQKVGDSEILVADGLGKKAFIIEIVTGNYVDAIESLYTDAVTEEDDQFVTDVFSTANVVISMSQVIWEYNSNRYITSFYLVPVTTRQIEICDDAIRSASVFARQGDTLEWINRSSSPVSIYSGTTDYEEFQLNHDLTLYGSVFKSQVLQPGDKYTLKLVTVGEYGWFTYPDILTGKITITKNRINSDDKLLLAENDGLEFPFSSRVVEVDSWGNVEKSIGECYLVKPRLVRPLLNNCVIIST